MSCPSNKIEHPTRADALDAQKRLVWQNHLRGEDEKSAGLNVYPCEHCGAWHVGHSRSQTPLVYHYDRTPVVALVERGTGRVRAFPMVRVTADNLGKAIAAHVKPNARLITDDHQAYASVTDDLGMRHESVNHSRDEYVRGDVYTNTVEGFFSLLKRGVNGVFHHVSREHLNRYCDEFAFRYENRKVSDAERAKMLVLKAEGKRLTYKQPASASA